MLAKLSLLGLGAVLIYFFIILFPLSIGALFLFSILGLTFSGLVKIADKLFQEK